VPLTRAISPCFRLADNPRRLAEGGRRLTGFDQASPQLSVVTIALNPGPTLQTTLDAVLSWADERVEYIVIDGGSSDGTRERLASLNNRLSYWVSEPDQGISDAFNKGLSLCRAPVVGLINAGDWYEPTTPEHVLTAFAEDPQLGVLCGRLQFWHGSEPATLCDSEPDLLTRDMTVTHPTCFIRRQLYLEHGGFSDQYRLAMDYELLLRLLVAGVRFQRSDAVLANMVHDGLAEQNWRAALIETHAARCQHLAGHWTASQGYLTYLITRRRTRFLLQRLGLHGIIRLYRERLAAVRKVGP
jgi:glycosyltransferase involved in cell wall biosynthesis